MKQPKKTTVKDGELPPVIEVPLNEEDQDNAEINNEVVSFLFAVQ